jgi:hypothetical protein
MMVARARGDRPAQNFPRDILRGILRPMFGGVECDDPNRVVILAGHQVGDGGFEIGFSDIGFRECRAEVSVIVDDEIRFRSGPFGTIEGTKLRSIKTPIATNTGNLSTKSRRGNRSLLPPTALAMMSGERFGAGFGMGARAMSASVISATRTGSEIGV